MRNKTSKSLIFKVVGFHLLLFSVFFVIINIFHNHLQLMQVFFLIFLLSLATTNYFAYKMSRSIKTVSEDIDRIADGDFSIVANRAQSRELEELSKKIAHLRSNIQHTQNDLENQHNQLNGILTYMTDGVIATDPSGQVILANTAALIFLATSTYEILQKNIAEALGIDDYYAFRDLLDQTPNISIDSENSYGEYTRLRVNFSLFRRETGYISGIVAILHDITEEERIEREQRLFVSNVSHELRTPLTTIKSYLETLNSGVLQDNTLTAEFIKTSLDETNHMSRMISDLLVLSRIDEERFTLNKEIVNLVAFLAHELARFSQILANNNQFKLEQNIPIQPIWIELDTDKMGQVFDNLLSNAIKYSPDGGTITVELQTTNTQATIRIRDEGIGIPRVDQPRIFDRFYRVDKARSHDQGGAGLGLAIVYDIIKLHNGSISVHSKLNKGSEFTITLPYTPLDFSDYENEDWGNGNDKAD